MITKRILNSSQHPSLQPMILISIFTLFLCFASLTYAQDETLLPIESVPGIDAEIQFKDYSGKVILIDFWASWCGPCRQSFPWMNQMQSKYAGQGLTVIAINLDSDPADANDFLKEVPANFLLGFDPEGITAEVMNIEAMPMSYLVDRQGNITHRMMGFNTEKKAEHEAYIQALLNDTK